VADRNKTLEEWGGIQLKKRGLRGNTEVGGKLESTTFRRRIMKEHALKGKKRQKGQRETKKKKGRNAAISEK